MVGADIQVGTAPNGDKAVIVVDPSGIKVIIPMTDEGARAAAQALTGGIAIVKNLELLKG